MERLAIDQSYVESLAAREFQSGVDEDTDLDPQHRRDRIAVDDTTSPVVADAVLKRFDHVRLWDWLDGVVIGPARNAYFLGVHVPELAQMMGEVLAITYEAVTDRAPVDPNETPMPVWTPPPEEEPPTEGEPPPPEAP